MSDRPHLRDLPVEDLPRLLAPCGVADPVRVRQLALAIHRRGALEWDELPLGRERRRAVAERFRFGPQLRPLEVRVAERDGARKHLLEVEDRERIEAVLIPHLGNHTLCLSSQAGCALGCGFCATAAMGLRRDLTAGEITEGLVRAEREAGVRVTDVVFMGMGEPLHNYDAVLTAAENLNHPAGHGIARKRITISTAGLVPGIRRFTAERRRVRLHLSLHSAIQETRERLMPVARRWPLPELVDAMREHQRVLAVKWLTFQYVALPGVNLDDDHVDALGRELAGLRYILNVIPWNDLGDGFAAAGLRSPTWDEVRDFTARLRRLRCPVKVRYSAGKHEGMGCGQLAGGAVRPALAQGHMAAPPGIFTG